MMINKNSVMDLILFFNLVWVLHVLGSEESSGRPRSGILSMDNPLIAGAVSAFSSCLILQPLDVYKTRLQEAPGRPKSPAKILVGIVRQNGMRGLWRGVVPSIWRNVPGTGLYFLTLSHLKYLALVSSQRWPVCGETLVEKRPNGAVVISPFGNVLLGSTARVGAGFVLMPMTIVKVRFESSHYKYASIWSSLAGIQRTEGLRGNPSHSSGIDGYFLTMAIGLFRGFGATALRDAPFAGIYISFYEAFKTAYREHVNLGNGMLEPFHVRIATGLLAGLAATIITQPFDMVKSRIQLKPAEYRNILVASRKIMLEESLWSLFTGIGPRLARKSLTSAITWAIYEELTSSKHGTSSRRSHS